MTAFHHETWESVRMVHAHAQQDLVEVIAGKCCACLIQIAMDMASACSTRQRKNHRVSAVTGGMEKAVPKSMCALEMDY